MSARKELRSSGSYSSSTCGIILSRGAMPRRLKLTSGLVRVRVRVRVRVMDKV